MGLRHRPTGELVGVSACLFESRAETLTPTQPANELVRRKSLYYHYRYYFFSNYHFHFMYSFMCLSIGLFIYLYICIHLFIYLLSITVFIHVSLIYAFIFSIYLSIYPPIYLSTYLLLNPFNDRFIITLQHIERKSTYLSQHYKHIFFAGVSPQSNSLSLSLSSQQTLFYRMYDEVMKGVEVFEEKEVNKVLSIYMLGVHKDFGGRGFGRKLVEVCS